jgi:hypothetical protein
MTPRAEHCSGRPRVELSATLATIPSDRQRPHFINHSDGGTITIPRARNGQSSTRNRRDHSEPGRGKIWSLYWHRSGLAFKAHAVLLSKAPST